MTEEQQFDKLRDLTRRAISINENLLAEERKFIEALSDKRDLSYLKASSDAIVLLIRKETLYTQAAHRLLENVTNA